MLSGAGGTSGSAAFRPEFLSCRAAGEGRAALSRARPDRVEDVFGVLTRPLRERERAFGGGTALRAGGPVVPGLFRGSGTACSVLARQPLARIPKWRMKSSVASVGVTSTLAPRAHLL